MSVSKHFLPSLFFAEIIPRQLEGDCSALKCADPHQTLSFLQTRALMSRPSKG